MIRTHLLLASLVLASLASAQNATISRFKFWTADTAHSIYGDSSAVFRFKGPDGNMATIPVADTLYSWTIAQLNRKLDIKIEDLIVDGTASEESKEPITGFPDRKRKTVLADGRFGYVVEVEAIVFGPMRKVKGKKDMERVIDMAVTVETYDGAGNRTAKYSERTSEKDLKNKARWAPGFISKVGITGNQIMALYMEAFENAMNMKR